MPLTPMMQKYMETKEEYKDCILFYRLGDFYEMFFEDAKTCSQELDLTLTGKSCGLEERAPMCGVPFHSADIYIDKLVGKGYKVAICEQVEDPKLAKGLVKREVIRVATPGTNLNTNTLDESRNNYLMCIVYTTNAYGVSYVDVTTGDYYVTEFDTENKLLDEIGKTMPSEIICNDSFVVSGIDLEDLRGRLGITVSAIDHWYFDEDGCRRALQEHFGVSTLSGLGLDDYSIGIVAAGAVMQYLTETQKISLDHIRTIKPYAANQFMLLDRATRRNLELCETMREKAKRGSLFWVLDKTKTAMGARLLRNSIEQPLVDPEEIDRRLDMVEELNENINQVNDGVKTIEKAIPYIDPKYQKNLEIMVKIMELQKVINSFSAITIQSKNPEEKSRKMLMAIKPELDNKKQKMLDLFVKVMEIKTIMEGIYGK